MSWGGTLVSFGAPAIVLFVTTRVAIPSVSRQLGLPPIVWFLAFGALYVLVPLLVIALLRLRAEALEEVAVWRERLRFRALRATDWKWIFGSVALSGSATMLAVSLLRFAGVGEIVPGFLANSGEHALAPRDLAMSWLCFCALSVAAQEILWRGVYLPRQEQAFGERAWMANAAGWGLFHLALGWTLFAALLPMLIAVPFVAQRRENALAAAIVHASALTLALLQLGL
jgi:hypothetical protein